MICEPCNAKGWLPHPTLTAITCSVCQGKGELTWGALARLLQEYPTTIARVRQLRSKQEVNLRVLDKVCALLRLDMQQATVGARETVKKDPRQRELFS